MLYIDLFLSLILFIMGIISLITGKFRNNPYINVLLLALFPLSIFTYYLKDYNITLFGNIVISDIVAYPIVKIIIILALYKYLKALPNRKGL